MSGCVLPFDKHIRRIRKYLDENTSVDSDNTSVGSDNNTRKPRIDRNSNTIACNTVKSATLKFACIFHVVELPTS
jgi:hypothetical protein